MMSSQGLYLSFTSTIFCCKTLGSFAVHFDNTRASWGKKYVKLTEKKKRLFSSSWFVQIFEAVCILYSMLSMNDIQ